jgi:hypothetical protein
MKNGLFAAVVLAGALALTGCGQGGAPEGKDITRNSSAKDIGAAYLTEMTRIADALETVKDEQSARAAAVQISKAAAGLNKMGEAVNENMDPLKAMQIFGDNYAQVAEVQGRMMTSLMRIQQEHPELMDIISSEMDKLEN